MNLGLWGSISPKTILGAIARGGGGAAEAPIEYSFRDDFTTDDNTPLTTPRTAEPGPGTWTVTDTNSVLAISSGKLTIAGTTGVNISGMIAASGLSRADGLTLMCIIDSLTNGDPIIGFSLTSSLAFTQLGIHASDGLPVSRHSPIIQFASDVNDFSTYAVTAFSTGSAIFGYDGSSWKLLFIERLTTTATLYPQINNHNEALVNYAVPGIGVTTLSDLTLASLQTSGIASANAGDTLTHAANCVLEATYTFSAGQTYEISFRRTDDDNRWILRAVVDTDTVTLVKVEEGVETVVATDATKNLVTTAASWFHIRMSGNTIIAGFDSGSTDGTLFAYTSATFNNTATGAKVNLASTNFYSYAEAIPAGTSSQLAAMRTDLNP